MSISKFNHNSNVFTFKADKDFKYYKLKDLAQYKDKVFQLRALFISTKGRYGDSPVAVTDLFYVNLPSHLLDDVRNIIRDPETVADINAGKCGFKVRAYQNQNGGESYSVEWVEMEDMDTSDLTF